jgi:hypothetical protein
MKQKIPHAIGIFTTGSSRGEVLPEFEVVKNILYK